MWVKLPRPIDECTKPSRKRSLPQLRWFALALKLEVYKSVMHDAFEAVKGYQGKTDPGLANGRTLVLKDGRSFYIGSVGGPNDGAEPQ